MGKLAKGLVLDQLRRRRLILRYEQTQADGSIDSCHCRCPRRHGHSHYLPAVAGDTDWRMHCEWLTELLRYTCQSVKRQTINIRTFSKPSPASQRVSHNLRERAIGLYLICLILILHFMKIPISTCSYINQSIHLTFYFVSACNNIHRTYVSIFFTFYVFYV